MQDTHCQPVEHAASLPAPARPPGKQLSADPAPDPSPTPGKACCHPSGPNYIPWKGYFDLINLVDEFVLYDNAQYTRRDWRNRNKIKTSQGTCWLTVPVEVKGKYTQLIRETRISDPAWPRKHWQSILPRLRQSAPFPRAQKSSLKISIWEPRPSISVR